MSLATRCPACGTIFRVVQDQLKVSEGWVRCGQCQEIFHGIESLFDLGSPASPMAASEPPAPPAAAPGSSPTPAAAVTAPTSAPLPARRGMSPTFAARVAARLAEDAARAKTQASVSSGEGEAAPVGAPEQHLVVDGADDEPPAAFIEDGPVSEAAITWLPDAGTIAGAPSAAELPSVGATEPEAPSDAEEALLEGSDFAAAEANAPLEDVEPADAEARSDEPSEPAMPEHPESLDAAPVDVAAVDAPAEEAGPVSASMTQGRALAEADDAEEDDGGPHTLAALLPEPVGEWPPRRRRERKAPLPAIEARQREAAARNDPRFVREARRGERWTRPWVRASLGIALVVLVFAAATQVAWPLRDLVAARWPALQPMLAFACEQLGCTLEAPRSLASLALDGSSLTRTEADHVLLFSADLHNRSDHAVRMPSFDLSFMDLNGQVVARKVLAPAQIGIRQGSLGPDAELHVHARLQISGIDATGFQAEMFYP